MEGKVKFYNQIRRYGFIIADDETEAENIFFHYSSLLDSNIIPEENMKVSFDLQKTEKGLSAINVKIIE